VPLVGLQYKDEPDAGLKWLAEHGNPYVLSAQDRDGRVGIDFGVYGVPETFVIDRQGIIRHKYTGPLTPQLLRDDLLPLVKKLEAS
jgi:cytochrome c biogenesis protein CcmG/thiol:disulfide interchange protein DsbE